MSGILEQLMAKADVLIEALNENTKARLAGAGDAPAATTAAAAAEPAKRGRPTKAAAETPAGPKTTEADLVAKFDEIKGTDTEKRMPALKKIIADAGFASLKELRMAPAKFDEVMAALTTYEQSLTASTAATDEDDDL
jgi:hypothetical protein